MCFCFFAQDIYYQYLQWFLKFLLITLIEFSRLSTFFKQFQTEFSQQQSDLILFSISSLTRPSSKTFSNSKNYNIISSSQPNLLAISFSTQLLQLACLVALSHQRLKIIQISHLFSLQYCLAYITHINYLFFQIENTFDKQTYKHTRIHIHTYNLFIYQFIFLIKQLKTKDSIQLYLYFICILILIYIWHVQLISFKVNKLFQGEQIKFEMYQSKINQYKNNQDL
ncbi:transmembrane protein, putative (macronuclear) [Tetrahymena thermophila SB210]|uniref:Transmembrane protein, putative n=1 Tax=Tetrahymena thermophila (strain SB210) TaxID=312017 RepID=W7XKB8_TETTS|nr:transmembrane protein, putative [Tetrahymena thermophila SB210]EWS76376.1 transmembrane protein, putative [Tetrahymena thermophila SB210]|eukprot:XP_012651160.1 transmembrane protein, putative [Tetrahymena thermophila SB210]